MNVPEVFIEFCLVGEDFDPQEITAFLGMAPTDSAKKHRVYNTEAQQYSYESYWSIETEKSETWDVTDHLNLLIKQLAPRKAQIIEIAKRLKAEIKFLICISLHGANGPSVYFEPTVLQFFSDIGAACDVDISR